MLTPTNTVFVGDLPADINDESLQSIFAAYGKILSFKVLSPGARGSGNAIVSFSTIDEASWLVNNLNGNIPTGLSSAVTINYKNEGGKGAGKGKHIDNSTPSNSVFVGDLPNGIDDATLKSMFASAGTITSQKILPAVLSGVPAVISFATIEEAKNCIDTMHNTTPPGMTSPIKVTFKQAKGAAAKGSWDSPQDPWSNSYWGAPFMPPPMWGPPAAGGWPKGGKAPEGSPSNTIFVGDLPSDIDDATIVSVFGAYGVMTSHKLLPPARSGTGCIVSFKTEQEADWCVKNLDGNIPQGLSTQVKVRFKSPAMKGGGKGGDSGWGGGKGKGWGGWGDAGKGWGMGSKGFDPMASMMMQGGGWGGGWQMGFGDGGKGWGDGKGFDPTFSFAPMKGGWGGDSGWGDGGKGAWQMGFGDGGTGWGDGGKGFDPTFAAAAGAPAVPMFGDWGGQSVAGNGVEVTGWPMDPALAAAASSAPGLMTTAAMGGACGLGSGSEAGQSWGVGGTTEDPSKGYSPY